MHPSVAGIAEDQGDQAHGELRVNPVRVVSTP